jgi:alanyl-tRNA synthetase
LSVFYDQGILPGNKGRNYVCRRLLRRYIRLNSDSKNEPFKEWINPEFLRMEKSLRSGRQYFRRNPDKTPEFWWDTFGILPEEMHLLS